MKLKTLAATVSAALALASVANAATYHLYGSGGGFKGNLFYMNSDTLREVGGYRTVWEVQIPFHSGADGRGLVNYSMMLAQFDCVNQRYHILQGSDYDMSGNIMNNNSPPGDWEYVIPGSIAASALDMACNSATLLTDKGFNVPDLPAFVTWARGFAVDHGMDKQ